MLRYNEVKKDNWKLTWHEWGYVSIENLEDENEVYVWQDYDNSDDTYFKLLCRDGDWHEALEYIVRQVS